MSASQSEGAPQNALSVLLAALPSDVASSIEAGINVVSEELFATVDVNTADPTTRPTSPPQIDSAFISTSRSEPSGRPTSRYTVRPTTDSSPSSPTTRPTSQPTWLNTTRPTSHPTSPSTTHRPSTLATLPSTTSTTSHITTSTTSSTSSPTPSSTLTADTSTQQPPINTQKQAANGTIAGVATGAIAGVVLITLALFFFLRRRNRQKALKAVEEKTSQPYPAVAWLYDPARTPPRSQSPTPGGANLASGGEAGAAAKRSSLLAPEVVMMPEGEPLLAPGRAATRDSSPGASGGPSRSASPRVEVR